MIYDLSVKNVFIDYIYRETYSNIDKFDKEHEIHEIFFIYKIVFKKTFQDYKVVNFNTFCRLFWSNTDMSATDVAKWTEDVEYTSHNLDTYIFLYHYGSIKKKEG
jgi:hypothetical protein